MTKRSSKSRPRKGAFGGLFQAFGEPDDAPAPPIAPEALAAPAPDPAPEAPLTVTALAARIDEALREGIPGRVRVRGEVSNFNDRTHWYFALKDAESVISCVMFTSAARRMRLPMRAGIEVIATGRIEHYARQGRTQLYVESLDPVGAGALEVQFRALCDDLRARGWFDEDRKRALPAFPRRLAVVTSKTGAALQDVLDTLKRRAPGVGVLLVDVRVQGERAAPEIAGALRLLSRRARALDIDAILVTRGGGSIEDLWAFNEVEVAQAIVESSIPVVAAIGHETDVAIAELVADVRAATPTQAAVLASPDREALAELLDRSAARLGVCQARLLQRARETLSALARSPALVNPRRALQIKHDAVEARRARLESVIRARIHRVSVSCERLTTRLARKRPAATLERHAGLVRELGGRLDRAAVAHLERRASALASLERQLRLAGPANVLERGFSITFTSDGRVLREPWQASTDETLVTRLARGEVRSVVADDGDSRDASAEDLFKGE